MLSSVFGGVVLLPAKANDGLRSKHFLTTDLCHVHLSIGAAAEEEAHGI
jgi:hypothetical protein